MERIRVPKNFEPRAYQLPFLERMEDGGCLRAVLVWHRRSGKEKVCLNFAIKKMLERVGIYYYGFPELNQGRKILWDGIDRDGFKFLDHFPPEIIAGEINNTEMKIKLKNGSLFQVVGADRYDSLMGTNPIGMVFSEYALQDPTVWGYFRPILAENKGWVIFNGTPRGENHFLDIYNIAKNDAENWFSEVLTVSDTMAIDKKILEQELREIVSLYGNDSLYQQEYFCNFSVPIVGAYYSEQLKKLYELGRICSVQYDNAFPVSTYWDLGINDKMAIWFSQTIGNEVRLIDYKEGSGKGLDWWIKLVKEKPYIYQTHNAPHDIRVRELTTGRTRLEIAQGLGIEFNVVPNIPIPDGINAVRNVLRRCYFDKDKCKEGLNALKNYRKQWDEKRNTYLDNPYHDWSSNGADAFRMLAVATGNEIIDADEAFEFKKHSAPKYIVSPMFDRKFLDKRRQNDRFASALR